MKPENRLKKALCELMEHGQTMDKFFAPVPETFRIEKGVIAKDNLWRILLLSIQSRAGPSLPPPEVKELRKEVWRAIDLVKAKGC